MKKINIKKLITSNSTRLGYHEGRAAFQSLALALGFALQEHRMTLTIPTLLQDLGMRSQGYEFKYRYLSMYEEIKIIKLSRSFRNLQVGLK